MIFNRFKKKGFIMNIIITKNKPGIKVKSIVFLWSESAIDEGLTVGSYSEADKILQEQARWAPENGGYDKTKFLVKFENGNTYEGRFDLKRHDRNLNNLLQRRMRRTCGFYSGRIRPAHMTQADYDAVIGDLADDIRNYCADLLDHYDLEDSHTYAN